MQFLPFLLFLLRFFFLFLFFDVQLILRFLKVLFQFFVAISMQFLLRKCSFIFIWCNACTSDFFKKRIPFYFFIFARFFDMFYLHDILSIQIDFLSFQIIFDNMLWVSFLIVDSYGTITMGMLMSTDIMHNYSSILSETFIEVNQFTCIPILTWVFVMWMSFYVGMFVLFMLMIVLMFFILFCAMIMWFHSFTLVGFVFIKISVQVPLVIEFVDNCRT